MEAESRRLIRLVSANFPCNHCGKDVHVPAIFKNTKPFDSVCSSTSYLTALQTQVNYMQSQIGALRNEHVTYRTETSAKLEDYLKQLEDNLMKNIQKKVNQFKFTSKNEKNKRKVIITVLNKTLEKFNQDKKSVEECCVNLENRIFRVEIDRKQAESEHLKKISDLENSKESLNQVSGSLEKRFTFVEKKLCCEEICRKKSENDLLEEINHLKDRLKYEEMSRHESNTSFLKEFERKCQDLEKKVSTVEDSHKKAELENSFQMHALEKSQNSLVKDYSNLREEIQDVKEEITKLSDVALKKTNNLENKSEDLIERCSNLEEKLNNEDQCRKKLETDLHCQINVLKDNLKYEGMSRQELNESFVKKFDNFEKSKFELNRRCETLEGRYYNLENKFSNEEERRKTLEDEQLIKMNKLEKSENSLNQICSDLKDQLQKQSHQGGLVQKRCEDLEDKFSNEVESRRKTVSEHFNQIIALEKSRNVIFEQCSNLEKQVQNEKKEREKLSDVSLKKTNDLENKSEDLIERCSNLEEKFNNEEQCRKKLETDLHCQMNAWKDNLKYEGMSRQELNESFLKKFDKFEKDQCELIRRCETLEGRYSNLEDKFS